MTLRAMLGIVVAAAVACLTGCANYRAVNEFGEQTTSMTGVVRTEFKTVETLCVQQAEVVLVVNNIADDKALAQCDAYRRAQGRFAAVTIDVLDDYAGALEGLANDKSFDLSDSIKDAGDSVRALRDASGNAVADAAQADAVTRIANLLVEVYASSKRDEAVDRMVQATPDLAVLGRALRAFFAAPPTTATTTTSTSTTQPSPSGAPTRSPYANFVGVIAGSATSTQLILQSQPMRKAEPIRTAELQRELRVRQRLLDRRTAATPDAVPARIVAAIDAWLAALDTFAVDARKPDSRELVDRIRRLRSATRGAKDAITAF